MKNESQYVQLDPPIGITTLQMRPERFMVTTAQRFSTHKDSYSMDFEDAVIWYELAVKGGAVYG